MEEQMLFENLDEKLEDEVAVITTTWLSINFELPICDSEGLLNKYFTSHSNLSAVFVLTGQTPEGEVVVRLTPHEKLKESEALFVGKPSLSIYSVQRHPCRSSTTLATSDLLRKISTDALKRLVTIPWCPTESARPPLVSCENKRHELVKPSHPPPVMSVPPVKSEKSKPMDVANFFAAAQKSTSTTVPPKQPQKRPSNFFGAKPVKKVSPKKAEPEKTVVVPPKEKVEEEEEEEEEEEFLTSAVSRSSKRKRLIVDSDEEEGPSEPVATVSKSQLTPRKSPKSPRPGQKTSPKATKKILAADSETDSPTPKPTRGRKPRAAPVAEETEKKESTASPSHPIRTTVPSPKKATPSKSRSPVKANRRKRQVMKTFMDEDGYMVTEKVWESASEDDEEEAKPEEPASAIPESKPTAAKLNLSPSKHDGDACLTGTPTLGPTKSVQPSKKPSKKAAPKTSSKQASISSFFTRS